MTSDRLAGRYGRGAWIRLNGVDTLRNGLRL